MTFGVVEREKEVFDAKAGPKRRELGSSSVIGDSDGRRAFVRKRADGDARAERAFQRRDDLVALGVSHGAAADVDLVALEDRVDVRRP